MARVLFLSQGELGVGAAHALNIVRTAAALRSLGHEIFLVARSSPDSDVAQHYGVDTVPDIRPAPPNSSIASAVYNAHQQVRALKPDLVWTRELTLAGLYAGRAPLVLELHQAFEGRNRRLLQLALRNRRLARVVAVHPAIAESVEKIRGPRTPPILVAPNAHMLTPPPAPATLTAGDQLSASWAGNPFRGKGQRVINELAEAMPHVRFCVAVPSQSQGAAFVTTDNLEISVGLAPAEVGRFIQESQISLLPLDRSVRSRGGAEIGNVTCPLKMVEAMWAGRAIVASDVAALRPFLAHDQSALLIDPEDVDGWVGAIEQLGESRDAVARLGRGAQEAFRSNHDPLDRVTTIVDGLL